MEEDSTSSLNIHDRPILVQVQKMIKNVTTKYVDNIVDSVEEFTLQNSYQKNQDHQPYEDTQGSKNNQHFQDIQDYQGHEQL